jgi:hypothetical protein
VSVATKHIHHCQVDAEPAGPPPGALARYAPWAFKGRGKGGCGGAAVDRWRGAYVEGGYMSPDGQLFECAESTYTHVC